MLCSGTSGVLSRVALRGGRQRVARVLLIDVFFSGFSRRNFCSRDSFENPRVPVHVASLAEFGVNRVSHHSLPFTRNCAYSFVKMKVSEDSNPILYGIILNYHSPRGVIVA